MAQHLYDPLDPAFTDNDVTRVERSCSSHRCRACPACGKRSPQVLARADGIES